MQPSAKGSEELSQEASTHGGKARFRVFLTFQQMNYCSWAPATEMFLQLSTAKERWKNRSGGVFGGVQLHGMADESPLKEKAHL